MIYSRIREWVSLSIFILTLIGYIYYVFYFYPIKCYNYGAFNMGYGFIMPFAIFVSFTLHTMAHILTKSKIKRCVYCLGWLFFVFLIIPMPFPCRFL